MLGAVNAASSPRPRLSRVSGRLERENGELRRANKILKLAGVSPQGACYVGRMLMTRASTTTRTLSESIDCRAIRPFARRVNGAVSVGLNATTFV